MEGANPRHGCRAETPRATPLVDLFRSRLLRSATLAQLTAGHERFWSTARTVSLTAPARCDVLLFADRPRRGETTLDLDSLRRGATTAAALPAPQMLRTVPPRSTGDLATPITAARSQRPTLKACTFTLVLCLLQSPTHLTFLVPHLYPVFSCLSHYSRGKSATCLPGGRVVCSWTGRQRLTS